MTRLRRTNLRAWRAALGEPVDIGSAGIPRVRFVAALVLASAIEIMPTGLVPRCTAYRGALIEIDAFSDVGRGATTCCGGSLRDRAGHWPRSPARVLSTRRGARVPACPRRPRP